MEQEHLRLLGRVLYNDVAIGLNLFQNFGFGDTYLIKIMKIQRDKKGFTPLEKVHPIPWFSFSIDG